MLFREVVLWAGRLAAGLVFLYVLSFYKNNLEMLSASYIFLASLFLMKAIVGYWIMGKIHDNINK